MSWSSIKEAVSPFAPLLGKALALTGPVGAVAGGLLANALGVDETPDAVAQAIQSDPNAVLRIKEVELNNAAQLQRCVIEAQTTRLTEINKTMRAEYAADGWFKTGWRPMIGYMLAFSMGGVMAGLVYSLFKHPENAGEIVANATIIISAMCAVVGVNIRERSKDKAAAMGQTRNGVLDKLFTRSPL